MKTLRQTIRKILLENQQHFGKLAELICSEDIENINQAFELAAAIECVGHVEYTLVVGRHNYKNHAWKITGGYDPSFLEALKDIIYSATWGLRPRNTTIRFKKDSFELILKESPNRN